MMLIFVASTKHSKNITWGKINFRWFGTCFLNIIIKANWRTMYSPWRAFPVWPNQNKLNFSFLPSVSLTNRIWGDSGFSGLKHGSRVLVCSCIPLSLVLCCTGDQTQGLCTLGKHCIYYATHISSKYNFIHDCKQNTIFNLEKSDFVYPSN